MEARCGLVSGVAALSSFKLIDYVEIMRHMLVTLLVLISLVFPAVAFACTPATDTAIGGSWGELIPRKVSGVPSNFRILHASARYEVDEYLEWKIWRDDELIDLEIEEEETYEYGSGVTGSARVWRPSQPLRAGDRVESSNCCLKHVLGSPDHTPPPQPVLSVVSYHASGLYDDCGPMRLGTLVLDAGISRVEELSLLAMIYVGEDSTSAQQTERIAHIRRAYDYQGDFTFEMYLHAKGLASPDEPFCIAVELEDTAGNRSPRSDALCFEDLEQMHPADRSAGVGSDMQPTTQQGAEIEERGCSTLSSPGKSPSVMWVLLSLVGLLHRRLRRAVMENNSPGQLRS